VCKDTNKWKQYKIKGTFLMFFYFYPLQKSFYFIHGALKGRKTQLNTQTLNTKHETLNTQQLNNSTRKNEL